MVPMASNYGHALVDLIESIHVLVIDLGATHHALCLVFNEMALSSENERRRIRRIASHIARSGELIERLANAVRSATTAASP